MRHYETRTQQVKAYKTTTCDGCGLDIPYYGTTVIISVNAGEEGGRVDEYDYCEDCLLARADTLVAAGSRAPLVTGKDAPVDEEDE
jgi:hypothetical protein